MLTKLRFKIYFKMPLSGQIIVYSRLEFIP